MNRKVLWAVLVVGLAMIAAPLVISLPGRASSGQAMIDDFHPLMQPANVATTASYYNDVFVPLGKIAPLMSDENVSKFEGYAAGFGALEADGKKLVALVASTMGMSLPEAQAYVARTFPATAQMGQALPQMQQDFGMLLGAMRANVPIFEQVPAGLDHYEPLVTTMEANVATYKDIDALPDFRLFTWFFVVPGVLLVALAGFGLVWEHRHHVVPTIPGRAVPSA